MGNVMEAADYRIDNTGSLAEFRDQAETVLAAETGINDLQH